MTLLAVDLPGQVVPGFPVADLRVGDEQQNVAAGNSIAMTRLVLLVALSRASARSDALSSHSESIDRQRRRILAGTPVVAPEEFHATGDVVRNRIDRAEREIVALGRPARLDIRRQTPAPSIAKP